MYGSRAMWLALSLSFHQYLIRNVHIIVPIFRMMDKRLEDPRGPSQGQIITKWQS